MRHRDPLADPEKLIRRRPLVGVKQRAPNWMQHSGLEWLYRLAQEPGLLWKRYLVSKAIFIGVLLAVFARRVLGGSPRA